MAFPLEKRQSDSFWLESITHQGKAAFNDDASYTVFRNVKDFGATGSSPSVSMHRTGLRFLS